METLDVKFSKFDNRPWGFRLAGGYDFPQPLTVIRVTEGSLAECMGLKVGDVVQTLNDQPIANLTHGQAHEALVLAGNNFVLGVRRTEDPSKAVEGIEEDKIEPYMKPIEEILFAPIEENRETTPDEAPQIEEEAVEPAEPEVQEEIYPEKPKDENSENIANPKLTDEEIAQLILDEEEVLNEKGVLGVNFKKLRPRAPLFKESKVFQELQKEVNAEPPQVQELKRQTTFLQKPERPVPKTRLNSQSEDTKTESVAEPYRVVIKKQPKKSVTEKLLEKGLIDPTRVKTPEPSHTSQVNEIPDSPDTTELPIKGTWFYTSSIDEDDSLSSVDQIEDNSLSSVELDQYSPLPFEENPVKIEQNNFVLVEPILDQIQINIYSLLIESIPDQVESLTMLPINEELVTEQTYVPSNIIKTTYSSSYDEIVPSSFVPVKKVTKPRLCRRGRYAKRCLNRALESLKPSNNKTKPRLCRRPHYFERVVNDFKRTVSGEKDPAEDKLLRVLMLASLACSIRDTYDTEILHRGSSRRNSRRMSNRRESNPGGPNCFENSFYDFQAKREAEQLNSFSSKCAEGRRRLSVLGMMVADKVNHAVRTDLARGLAYAMVPCATALAFFMFNYAKRYNNAE